MKAGTLKELISIQQSSNLENEFGECEKNWSSCYLVKAALNSQGTDRVEVAGNVRSVKTMEIETYYIADVTDNNRIVYNGESYEIKSVESYPDECRMVLKLKATA